LAAKEERHVDVSKGKSVKPKPLRLPAHMVKPLQLSNAVLEALEKEALRLGEDQSHLADRLLAGALDIGHNSIWQVSTTGALVEGLFKGVSTVKEVKQHGDFGLGTFAGLDGEGMLLCGRCYQATEDGLVKEVPDDSKTPFFVATHFSSDTKEVMKDIKSYDDLCQRLDGLRVSENVMAAIRITGVFKSIHWRVACPAHKGEKLVQATSRQAEFKKEGIQGTLLGFWTMKFITSVNVPGYHLHLLSDDGKYGGHILDLQAEEVTVELHVQNNLKVSLPTTKEYLQADLTRDPTKDLHKAESKPANLSEETCRNDSVTLAEAKSEK